MATRSKRLNIRVTDDEWQKLKAHAEGKKLSMAEVVRFYINSLPTPKAKISADPSAIAPRSNP